MPFIAYKALAICKNSLRAIRNCVDDEEWAKSGDEMIRIAEKNEFSLANHLYVIPDYHPSSKNTLDNVMDGETLFSQFDEAYYGDYTYWITPKKK